MIPVVALLSLVLLLAPLLSGVPDEPEYSSLGCFLVLLAVLIALWRDGSLVQRWARTAADRAETALSVLFGIALLSLLWRVTADHGIAYLGPMLRGWIIVGTELAVFALSRRAARAGRLPTYALILVAVLASAVVAEIGVTEYLTDRRAGGGYAQARIFATSTPDFLAGYLAMLLPPTLALFLGVPWRGQKSPLIGYALSFLLLIVLGYQALTLLRTQSRFALVSLAVGLGVFLLSLWRARRAGMTLEKSSRLRLSGVIVCLALFGLLFARPVIARLRQTSAADNSTAFRLYTWRGCIKMAAANPVLGTGIGSWVDLYPRYAITGFTRLAHDTYLQIADECGLPGLLALLAALGFAGAVGWRGLSSADSEALTPAASALTRPGKPVHPLPILGEGRSLATGVRADAGGVRANAAGGKIAPLSRTEQFLAAIAPADDRLLLAGLLGGLAASVVQNLIDSDWYVFFLGVTFWALAGLMVGMAEPQNPGPSVEAAPKPGLRAAIGVLAALMLADMAAQGVAASQAQQAKAALASPNPTATAIAEQSLANAAQWDPLKAHYPADLGLQVYFQREGRLPDALAALKTAVRLGPTAVNCSYLATVLSAEHQYQAAEAALRQGLRSDPNSLDIRLTLAQMLPPPLSVNYYRQITHLEDSPVGQVRALGGTVEYRFAIADAAVADAEAAAHDPAGAARYYSRAEKILEEYADEGGTSNVQRQALLGGHPDPALDAQMRDLYAHVMTNLIALAPPPQQAALRTTFRSYAQKYAAVFAHTSRPGTL